MIRGCHEHCLCDAEHAALSRSAVESTGVFAADADGKKAAHEPAGREWWQCARSQQLTMPEMFCCQRLGTAAKHAATQQVGTGGQPANADWCGEGCTLCVRHTIAAATALHLTMVAGSAPLAASRDRKLAICSGDLASSTVLRASCASGSDRSSLATSRVSICAMGQ